MWYSENAAAGSGPGHASSQYGGRKVQIIELPIEFEFNGQKKNIYPSLIVLNRGLTLVDTGYKNYLKLIEKEIVKNSYDMKDLKKCKHYTIR